jgi:hypothetical protein
MRTMLTDYDLEEIFAPLEALFGPLNSEQRAIYYDFYRYSDPVILKAAVRILLRSHDKRTFPLPEEVDEAINEASEKMRSELTTDFCHVCQNTGVTFMAEKIKTCSCIHGLRVEAILKIGEYDKKRVQTYIRKNSPTAALKGSLEWNDAIKDWELTKEEHDKWMERKRKELEEAKVKKVDGEIYGLKKTMDEIITGIEKLKEHKEGKLIDSETIDSGEKEFELIRERFERGDDRKGEGPEDPDELDEEIPF